jgi:Tol biopolymer transport system component
MPAGLRFLAVDGEYVHSRPCFSPAGDRVVFMRAPAGADPAATLNADGSAWSLWSVDRSGGAPDLLFEHTELRATRPDACPANRKIAFTGVRGGRAELWLLDEDGANPTHVAVGSPPYDRLFYASWYGDGRTLALTDYRRRQVLRVKLPSGEAEPLTDPGLVWAGMAAVSRDDVLAFAGQRPGPRYDFNRNMIWLQPPDGPPSLLDGKQGRMPSWSPDGIRLTLTSVRARSALDYILPRTWLRRGTSVFVADVRSATGAVVAVSPPDHTADHAKWSPDGRSITCMARSLRDGTSGIAVLDL